MATNSCGKKGFNVIHTIAIHVMCLKQLAIFPRIVKSFEAIASSLVQQQNFTTLVTTQNLTTFVAEKVHL